MQDYKYQGTRPSAQCAEREGKGESGPRSRPNLAIPLKRSAFTATKKEKRKGKKKKKKSPIPGEKVV